MKVVLDPRVHDIEIVVGRAMSKCGFTDASEVSPIRSTNEAQTLSQNLPHQIARVIVDCFIMPIGVAEHELDMFGLLEHAGNSALVRIRVDFGAYTIHFWLGASPDAVNRPMLVKPRGAVLDTVEELSLIALSVGPAVGLTGDRLARLSVVDGISSGKIVLSSLDKLPGTLMNRAMEHTFKTFDTTFVIAAFRKPGLRSQHQPAYARMDPNRM